MAYSQFGTIQAADYNTFASQINEVWSTGTGNTGYGQTTTDLNNVANPNVVQAVEWQNLADRVASARQHQSGAVSSIYRPNLGNTITYTTAIANEITNIRNNRFNNNNHRAAGVGSSIAGPITTFGTSVVKEVYLQWPTSENMRFFFNCGGYVAFSVTPTTFSATTKGATWNSLISSIGYVRIFNRSSDITGGGVPDTYNTNLGFWNSSTLNTGTSNLTTSYQTVVSKNVDSAVGGYSSGFISLQVRVDVWPNPTRLWIKSIMDDSLSADATSDDILNGTTRMDYFYYNPTTTYLTQSSWGTPTWSAAQTNTQS